MNFKRTIWASVTVFILGCSQTSRVGSSDLATTLTVSPNSPLGAGSPFPKPTPRSSPQPIQTPTPASTPGPTPIQAAVTSVELMGTISANQVVNGLGFNITDSNDWEFAAAASAGATHARMQCSWSAIEQQTAPPNNLSGSPQYVQDPNCVLGFNSAKKYGIHPTVVAAYGPPWHQILTVTIPQGAAVGATTLNIQFVSGVGGDTFANLKFPYDYINPQQSPNYGGFTKIVSYVGSFISKVSLTDSTHATITLSSALTAALPSGNTNYYINEILYPSAATTSPTDPSVIAYGKLR